MFLQVTSSYISTRGHSEDHGCIQCMFPHTHTHTHCTDESEGSEWSVGVELVPMTHDVTLHHHLPHTPTQHTPQTLTTLLETLQVQCIQYSVCTILYSMHKYYTIFLQIYPCLKVCLYLVKIIIVGDKKSRCTV